MSVFIFSCALEIHEMAEMLSRITPAMKLCVINAVVMALSSGLTNAQVVSGTPRVIDGDTLDFGSKIVRLHGIDAAESGQRCVGSDHQFTRPGDLAEARLSELVSAGVICEGSSTDDYGRLIILKHFRSQILRKLSASKEC